MCKEPGFFFEFLKFGKAKKDGNGEIWNKVCRGVISLSLKLYQGTFRVLGVELKPCLEGYTEKSQYIVNSLFLSLTFAGVSEELSGL